MTTGSPSGSPSTPGLGWALAAKGFDVVKGLAWPAAAIGAAYMAFGWLNSPGRTVVEIDTPQGEVYISAPNKSSDMFKKEHEVKPLIEALKGSYPASAPAMPQYAPAPSITVSPVFNNSPSVQQSVPQAAPAQPAASIDAKLQQKTAQTAIFTLPGRMTNGVFSPRQQYALNGVSKSQVLSAVQSTIPGYLADMDRAKHMLATAQKLGNGAVTQDSLDKAVEAFKVVYKSE